MQGDEIEKTRWTQEEVTMRNYEVATVNNQLATKT